MSDRINIMYLTLSYILDILSDHYSAFCWLNFKPLGIQNNWLTGQISKLRPFS